MIQQVKNFHEDDVLKIWFNQQCFSRWGYRRNECNINSISFKNALQKFLQWLQKKTREQFAKLSIDSDNRMDGRCKFGYPKNIATGRKWEKTNFEQMNSVNITSNRSTGLPNDLVWPDPNCFDKLGFFGIHTFTS